MDPLYPTLYQINTRVWLTELSGNIGRNATLDDIPDSELNRLAAMGFNWIWMLSVWTTGELGRSISRIIPEWRADFEKTLSDLREEDIAGSGFAIADYRVHPNIGGDEALKRLRIRMQQRGLKLILDFVPNHMGPDHKWVEEHPEFFISGTDNDLKRNPRNFTRIKRKKGDMVFAFGRDPYFSGWPDTVQIDYSNLGAVQAMQQELVRISEQCDGVRCDMAMLILPEVFERTWGRRAQNFWPQVIKTVKKNVPDFCFMAEVYWDMEWNLLQMGFDYAYDKRLYDRLHAGYAKPVREHFFAGVNYQKKLARFLENHDEQRAAFEFELKKHEAAAIITYFSPGLRFFHQGQLEGRTKRISPHLVRGPIETVNRKLEVFYTKILDLLTWPVLKNGNWQLLNIKPAWEGNETWDAFVAFGWTGLNGEILLVTVNFSANSSQCLLSIPYKEIGNKSILLLDLMTQENYMRKGNEMVERGLYIDLQAYDYHVFEVKEYLD